MNARFILVLAFLLLAGFSPLRAEPTELVIVKARAYLGSEAALNAVRSIHYTGTLEVLPAATGTDVPSPSNVQLERMPVEIVFQKPYQQQMTVTRVSAIDTMVLDDYDGWSRSTSRKNPKQSRIAMLEVAQIKQLRANTWENLNFFLGLEKNGGAVESGPEVTVDGVSCAKLSFSHSEGIVFHRYFEKSTGRLVKTETANGSVIREEGELLVDGIRFPRKILNKALSGQVTVITFEQVVLNEVFPANTFAVPSLLAD